MLFETKPFVDAFELLRQGQIPVIVTKTFFDQLIKEFKINYLESQDYERRIESHTRPIVVRNKTLNCLYERHSKIQNRKEINCRFDGENSNEYANVRIADILEEDKNITSSYDAMVEYCKVRSRDLRIVAVHYAEFLSVVQLIHDIRTEVESEEKRQSLILDTDLAYFKVLDSILLYGKNMEKLAGTVMKQDEAGYRASFIAHLDSLSDYSAKAETYNKNGRTDILVESKKTSEIILIAECKIWKGESELSRAIDQLLEKYMSSRDEKAALVVFNRDVRAFSEVEEKAIKATFSHRLCIISEYRRRQESSYSFVFKLPGDENRRIMLELILFNFACAAV